MLEIKILCPCGAKYKFDVEPLNGKLPGPVRCPVCAADGTTQGNDILSKLLPVSPIEAATSQVAPAPPRQSRAGFVAPVIPKSSKQIAATTPGPAAPFVSQPSTAAAPVQAVSSPPVPSPPAQDSAKKLSVSAVHVTAPAEVAGSPPSQPPTPSARIPDPPTRKPAAEPSLTRGYIGVAIASFVALVAWFLVTTFLWRKLGWIAIALGGMIGWSGQLLARQKAPQIGIAAAVAAVLVFSIGSIWSTVQDARAATDFELEAIYNLRVEYAKEAVKAKSDEEVKNLISEGLDYFEKEDPAFATVVPVTDRSINEWRRKQLPELRRWAEGQVSRLQFDSQKRSVIESEYSGGWIFSNAFRVSMLIWIALGAGAAWKVAAQHK